MFPRFLDEIRRDSILIYPFDIEVLNEGLILGRKLDIHNRVIVATAKVSGSAIVTKDKKISSQVELDVIW